MGYSDVWLQGHEESVFNLFNFYLFPEIRGKRLPEKVMKEFFSDAKGKADYGLAIVMKGNRQAESFIGRQGYDWMPPSRIIDELVVKSILFSFPKKNNTKYRVRNANPEDIPEMVNLLDREHKQRDFGIIFQQDDFLKNLKERGLKIEDYYVALNKKGEMKGVCLAWDCTSFRRTSVVKYSSAFYPVLLSYKALLNIFPLAPFPRKGESFKELTLTDYAAENRDVTIMNALLCEIYHRHLNRKYHFMNFASCGSDNLLNAVKGFWCRNIISHIIFTSFDPVKFNMQMNLPYVDIAFL